MLYERTAISRKPQELARLVQEALQEEDLMTPDLVFRDPYLLDFLWLEDTYSERDLEAAILRELERFLLELGTDFSFIARQKRMAIGELRIKCSSASPGASAAPTATAPSTKAPSAPATAA